MAPVILYVTLIIGCVGASISLLYCKLPILTLMLGVLLALGGVYSIHIAAGLFRSFETFPYYAAFSFTQNRTQEQNCQFPSVIRSTLKAFFRPLRVAHYIDGDYYLLISREAFTDDFKQTCWSPWVSPSRSSIDIGVQGVEEHSFQLYYLCDDKFVLVHDIPRYLASFGAGYG